jgi:hypothetical protein
MMGAGQLRNDSKAYSSQSFDGCKAFSSGGIISLFTITTRQSMNHSITFHMSVSTLKENISSWQLPPGPD